LVVIGGDVILDRHTGGMDQDDDEDVDVDEDDEDEDGDEVSSIASIWLLFRIPSHKRRPTLPLD
jgi:hypothetical protein